MVENSYCILQTSEYGEWVGNEASWSQLQVNERLSMIKCGGRFGDHKSISCYEKGGLKNKVWELRWKDGRRIYYGYILEKKILLLLGGNKNGQDKDVSKAKTIYLKTTKN